MRTWTSAIAALLTTLGLAAPAARADFYVCRKKDGNDWFTDRQIPGLKCRLALKTGTEGGDGASAAKGGQGYRPPSVGDVPRAVVGEPESAPERMNLYDAYVQEAAEAYQIPEDFIRAVMRVESNFHFQAVSSAGAQGLMQLMPKTGQAMGVHDPFDPRQNILGGTRFLRVLANQYAGDMVKVLSAYHAGAGAVAAKGGIPYESTEAYVRAVLDHYYQYKAFGAD